MTTGTDTPAKLSEALGPQRAQRAPRRPVVAVKSAQVAVVHPVRTVRGACAVLRAVVAMIRRAYPPKEYRAVLSEISRGLASGAGQTVKVDPSGNASLIRQCDHGAYPYGQCPECYRFVRYLRKNKK